MYDICTIGHITNDKVVTKASVKFMPGGTAFYFTKALQQLDIKFMLITALADGEKYLASDMQVQGIEVTCLSSKQTVYFENIYSADQNHRTQNVVATADPFSLKSLPVINATIYHLGPLLLQDIPGNIVKSLARQGLVSMDIQGYLRTVENGKVRMGNWKHKQQILPHVTVLKANEAEIEIVTGTTNVKEGAKIIAGYGVKEVVVTLGSKGSLIYTNGIFNTIPAFKPTKVIDATGCGDTYMAGYLYQKIKGATVEQAGTFGAAMATLKIQSSGPFSGTAERINELLIKHAALKDGIYL